MGVCGCVGGKGVARQEAVARSQGKGVAATQRGQAWMSASRSVDCSASLDCVRRTVRLPACQAQCRAAARLQATAVLALRTALHARSSTSLR